MNCAEFRRDLPEALDDVHGMEDNQHLRSCLHCSSLVADLNAISLAAKGLKAADEPSPRVWNSLEIELRREGLIRPQAKVNPPSPRSKLWNHGWLVAAAAAILLAVGLMEVQNGGGRGSTQTAKSGTQVAENLPVDEEQLLEEVAAREPSERAQYAVNLRTVDDYIRDAEMSARNNPNDEQAQQALMDAYDQRAMVYQMALNRSLP